MSILRKLKWMTHSIIVILQFLNSLLTLTSIFRVSDLRLAECKLVAWESASAWLGPANVILEQQNVLFVRVQSFHF